MAALQDGLRPISRMNPFLIRLLLGGVLAVIKKQLEHSEWVNEWVDEECTRKPVSLQKVPVRLEVSGGSDHPQH